MTHYQFVLVGGTGTGKTAQFLTMPEPRYADLFDPAADATLAGEGGECTRWFAGSTDIPLRSRDRKDGERGTAAEQPVVYNSWAKEFNEKLRSGFFERISTYMLDSLTLLGTHALNHQLWTGLKDERMAHRRAGEIITNVVWAISQLPCHTLLTLHTRYGENLEGKNEHRLTVPGGAPLTLPRFISALWYTFLVEGPKGPRWQILTRPQREHPHARTPRTFGQLPLYHDVTIEDWSRASDYGVGALLRGAKE